MRQPRVAASRSACRKDAAPAPAARGRGRQAGPPPGPAPRTADGRVMLGGATPSEKGVWLPGGGGGQTPSTRPTFRFSRGRRRCSPIAGRTSSSRTRAASRPASTRQFLTPYGVEFVELPEIAARLHLRHRRPAHVPDHLHGRPHASGESRAELLRPLDRLVGRRHAGRRHHRLQRRLLDGPARLAAHRKAAHARTLHAHRFARRSSTK